MRGTGAPNIPVRLQKHLSDRGVASRRQAAEWIRAGRIALNGVIVIEPGLRVRPDADAITLDGKPVSATRPLLRTIALNKPRGYISSRSSREGKSVLELLPDEFKRLTPAGRLDRDSEGLMLLSNDGDLILRVTHPRFGHAKRYMASVSGTLTEQTLQLLRSPMQFEKGPIRPAAVRVLRSAKNSRYMLEFILKEGRNRQIRRMCERAGLDVRRLERIQVGCVKLGGLRCGKWRKLTSAEIHALKQ